VDGADNDIHIVALDELVDVVGPLRGFRFVVDGEVLELPSAELAALLADIELETVLDRAPQRRIGAGIGQHEADLDLGGLGPGQLRSTDCAKGAYSTKRLDHPAALPRLFVRCHGLSSWKLIRVLAAVRASSYTTHHRPRGSKRWILPVAIVLPNHERAATAEHTGTCRCSFRKATTASVSAAG
jgi:hypothetical protein